MVDQSASFGWCKNDRGTDAEEDATSLKNCSSQEVVGHGRQFQHEEPAGAVVEKLVPTQEPRRSGRERKTNVKYDSETWDLGRD